MEQKDAGLAITLGYRGEHSGGGELAYAFKPLVAEQRGRLAIVANFVEFANAVEQRAHCGTSENVMPWLSTESLPSASAISISCP